MFHQIIVTILIIISVGPGGCPPDETGSTRALGRHWGEGWEPSLCRRGDPLKLHAWLALCSPLNAPAQSLCAVAGPRCEAGGSKGRAMPGQSMTSLAAASHRRARRYITLSPQLGQTEPNRLLVVFPLFMSKKKAWEKSRDPRPSLRTAEYCLHGNEGNKTTKLTGLSDPPQAGRHKSGVCNWDEWARAAWRGEESPRSPPPCQGAAPPQDLWQLLGKPRSQSASLIPVSQGDVPTIDLGTPCQYSSTAASSLSKTLL